MSENNFIDYVRICCRSGAGGAGSKHFHRDKYNSKGGPDGGNGGRGGNIILRGNKQLWTLLHLKYRKHVIADDGIAGGTTLKTGADGKDVILEVPLGTVAKADVAHKMLFEITEHNQTEILLSGGRGGLGNNNFKSPTNQSPMYAQPGESRKEEWKILELKLLADVGLVGFPNAGKSTLLSVVSEAKPKIADYAFTTLVPNLGVVSYRDMLSFVMADIPGIIEGAHKGKGLGIRFLRHIERNSVLLFLVPSDSPDIKKEFEILLNEIQLYNPELLYKKRILAISKSDLIDNEIMDEIKKTISGITLIFISSITNAGIDKLKDILWKQLND